MSERKVLNKYYPPDFDPSKIPRMKLAKNRQYTVRLMAPFNMRCVTCGEYIYKGKKFNARKEDVEHETYLGIRIYRFYIKCTRCLQEISFKTDPQNTDYEIEAGATRNFMALKLAEEQAKKELDELKEEEASNPMKLLENRTQQSRNEIELLESLEELRDLNRRQQSVDYEEMLKQYVPQETPEEMEKRLERQDEEYIKQVKFHGSGGSVVKRVAEEQIIEVEDLAAKQSKPTIDTEKKSSQFSLGTFKKPQTSRIGFGQKSSLANLVKRKSVTPTSTTTSVTVTKNTSVSTTEAVVDKPSPPPAKVTSTTNALSLLGGYDSNSDSD
ncbi:splicing factor YJU2 [Sitodiplosis mosellana]|uniref:splicing factor YJU2 n=1 Tax=Sitodiplosis mosellana TaxID=263140 RepID=UPI002444E968|nr:splicing factor YJU2 [Sitodiplosis mosellana]